MRSLRGEQVDFYFYPFLKKLEEMDEDLEKRVIETLSVVRSVCFHTGDKTHKTVFYDNLRSCGTFSFGDCGFRV